jgi:hypothetical protein
MLPVGAAEQQASAGDCTIPWLQSCTSHTRPAALQVLANQSGIVELLLKEGRLPADMRAAKTGATPLHALAALGSCKEAAGQTAAGSGEGASTQARAHMTRLLLRAGADVAAVDSCGAGILAAAAGGHCTVQITASNLSSTPLSACRMLNCTYP